MITIDLRDENLSDNLKAIRELQQQGKFTDEELQQMYDTQIKTDKESK